jgi:ubiquinone/menaquinone biosynthesis C-methylase UbiE
VRAKGEETVFNQEGTSERGNSIDPPSRVVFHPRFAAFYEWYARLGPERRLTDPLREATAGQAYGVMVEVGAGTGLNFAFHNPARVERVEATEPDSAMLAYVRERTEQAPVPITLTQAAVEALPFSDATFDSTVVTLVFCSVSNPILGLQEIKRVLKPGGDLATHPFQKRAVRMAEKRCTALNKMWLNQWMRNALHPRFSLPGFVNHPGRGLLPIIEWKFHSFVSLKSERRRADARFCRTSPGRTILVSSTPD